MAWRGVGGQKPDVVRGDGERDLVDTERGSPLEGVELTRAQELQLYRDGFIVLKGVIDKKLTKEARRLLKEAADGEAPIHAGRADIGSRVELTNLINKSRFTPLLQSLIGDFDPPQGTHVGVLPVTPRKDQTKSALPFYNAGVHMDGLTTTATQFGNRDLPPSSLFGSEGADDLDLFHQHYLAYIGSGRNPGRHAENYGVNGGMLFQDPKHSLTTGSFTLFAVACLNDQTEVGRGQFTVLRGSHHAMEQFYQMQAEEEGGILGPEGPGWPRISPMVPVAVREHFLDEKAQPDNRGTLFPQPTQCCMEEGDVTITMHAIPHAGTRNDGPEPRLNMIWRIRAKSRQPHFIHNGMTDHPDRAGTRFVNGEIANEGNPNGRGFNGEWMSFDQAEPPFFPGEVGNNPFERSKYALTHIWQEWPGMADIVSEMKATEQRTGVYPKGAHPTAKAEYAAHARAHDQIPTTPVEANRYWAKYQQEHPEAVIFPRKHLHYDEAPPVILDNEPSSRDNSSWRMEEAGKWVKVEPTTAKSKL